MKRVTRRDFLQSAAWGAGALAAGCGVQDKDASTDETRTWEQPNVVLIMLDTLRADKLGCYGYPHDVSPALDRIAERGVVFDQAVAQCTWTRPSCGSLLTGLYPRDVGLYKERNEALSSRFDTLAKVLKANGYNTFGATANPNLNVLYNFHEGFDEYIESSVVFSWMDQDEDTEIRGKVSLPKAPELYSKALDFARAHPEGPGYMQLNLMEIHEWYVRDSYTMRRPEYNGLFEDTGERYPKYLQVTRQLTDDTGDFVEKLSALPGWENTLFVLLSDHGEGLEDHPSVHKAKYHGRVLYESNAIVPWILYSPIWNPERPRIQQPVRLLELMPTVLEYARVSAPKGMAGVSLMPLINGEVDRVALPDRFILESHFRAPRLGVYDPAWKLFDNQPPHPTVPRYGLQPWGGHEDGLKTDQSGQNPEETAKLRRYLDQWLEEHPKTPPTMPSRGLSDEERGQLEAIGYLGDD
ncbi:MAG: sulfatase [Candidatus Hydrogenedentota bacterium]